jgi:hypothetical protein
MNNYPPVEVSMARLYRAGWCVGEILPGASPAGVWRVLAARGKHYLDVHGETQAEAWHGAAELAHGRTGRRASRATPVPVAEGVCATPFLGRPVRCSSGAVVRAAAAVAEV